MSAHSHLPPLAERLRPRKLTDLIGQEHISNPSGLLSTVLNSTAQPSMIIWGPPGVGKTSIATIIAEEKGLDFFSLSAINAGVKEVRSVIQQAQMKGNKPILFLDEIHRFSKSQQDALLSSVEKGIISLLGATTENPSFQINAALLSRSQVIQLHPLDKKALNKLLTNALNKDTYLSNYQIDIENKDLFFAFSGGDARKLYNLLELSVNFLVSQPNFDPEKKLIITTTLVEKMALQKSSLYDKNGEQHYDIISALIKSIRGSDPHAALYWLARMLNAGEDITFIARRLVISASEDIGLANPAALSMANSCLQAIRLIGNPESRIILGQCVVYLACSEKSNSSYLAIDKALMDVSKSGDLPIPLHLRNAPTRLMKDLDYGKDYKYPHNFDDNYTQQQYLPDELLGKIYYEPSDNTREKAIRKFLELRKLI